MTPKPSSSTRRGFLAGAAALSASPFLLASNGHAAIVIGAEMDRLVASQRPMRQEGADRAIRPFRVDVPQAKLDDLRRRIAATQWPEKETVADESQGVPLATMRELAAYWATDYDWRKCEARLNALPQFITGIDGLDIHFIHVRSRHANALPLVVTHGWPGSVIEQLKIIDPLVNPTAYGASAADAFHVVIPSVPGYGFSGKPTGTGWGPERVDRAWTELMQRLGYGEYIHANMPGTVPVDVDKGSTGPRPQAVYGIADSPVRLAAWLLDHGTLAELTRDESLDNVTLYWLTGTGVPAFRLYGEHPGGRFAVRGQPPLLAAAMRASFRPMRQARP